MAVQKFLGVKQVFAATYAATTAEDKKGYLWLVRTTSDGTASGTTIGGDIYYGTKHYGSLNDSTLTTKVDNIISSLQTIIDTDGAWVGFDDTHDLLKTSTKVSELFSALETAVLEAKQAASNAQSTADSKIASVRAEDTSVVIGGGMFSPTIGVQISAKATNAIKLSEVTDEEGLLVEIPAAPEYTLVKNTTVPEGLASQYWLEKEGVKVGANIDIPKDQFLKEATFIASAVQADKDIDPTVVIDDPYLKFVFTTLSVDRVVYVAVKKLVDIYTAGNGLQLVGSEFSAKVDAASETFLTVSANGIKLNGIQTAIDNAVKGEKDRAEASELKLTTDLDNEVIRAKAAEGDLTTLTTTEKGNLVGAVNELKGVTTSLQTDLTALDARVVTNTDNIATNTTDITAIQTQLTVTGDDVE